MERELMEMHDPVFRPGSTRIADASIKVTPTEVDCSVVLFLSKDGGVTKAASGGVTPFTSSGIPQQGEQLIVMPDEGVYEVFTEIDVAGVVIKIFQSPDNVTVKAAGEPRPLPKYGISSSYQILVANDASLALELDLI